ncbi:MAG: sodium:solute symporter family protein [Planctomycetaceae bacterium]|nr:sodium:solute symporter family protein [Planctomycetaceae bacterium]
MQAGQNAFGWIDWTVVVAYFAGITLYGLWLARKTHTSNAYFLGDRKLSWWVMLAQSFSTGTHAEGPVLQAGATFGCGFAGIWYQWKNMLITPFYWLIAPWYRRSQRTTVAEIVEDRYGRGMGLIYTIFAIVFFVFLQGVMLKGAGKAVAGATGGQISANGVVVAMTFVFMAYSLAGGLIASAHTNLIQGFLIILLSFMLLPVGLMAVGGFSGMRNLLPADFFELYNQRSGVDSFTVLMLAVNGLVGIVAQPHMISMCATGSNERAGRVGQTYGAIVKRLCAVGWALTGLIVAGMIVKAGITLKDPEEAFGYACLHFLGPGLVGLMVASIVAANMAACSNFMVNTGALFAKNLYVSYMRPKAGDREVLRVGRISGVLLTLLGVWFAMCMTNVLSAFMFTETIAALMGVMFLGGVIWKRANRQGAAASILVSFGVYYALNYLMTCKISNGSSPEYLWPAVQHAWTCFQQGTLGEFLGSGTLQLVAHWKGGPFGCTMLFGFATLILVSLLTKPESSELTNRFFDKMQRSSDDATSLDSELTVLAADRGEDLVLLDLPSWLTAARWKGFCHRYREDVVGFILACGSVALLILMAWGLMQIGK